MPKSPTIIKDKDKGFKKLMAQLGELGTVTIGVQGKDADVIHKDSDLSVGQIAAIHELGIGGAKRRSWLVSWMDANKGKMLKETKLAFKQVMKGTLTRNKALIGLGYAWTAGVRANMAAGKIRPALPATNPRGAGAPPLYDTHQLHDSITYKIFLAKKKSVKDAAQRKLIK